MTYPRRAKIEVVPQGSTLRQLVIDALRCEMAAGGRPRKRLARLPIKLAADAPLRRISPESSRRMDAEDLLHFEESKARAFYR